METIDPAKLKPYKKNSRTHSQTQIERIANSIKKFGFARPVVVWGDNQIVAGHGAVLAAIHIGLDAVPIHRVDHMSETEMKAYVIADNKLAEESKWDLSILQEELITLGDDGFNLELTGFELEDIADMVLDANLSEEVIHPEVSPPNEEKRETEIESEEEDEQAPPVPASAPERVKAGDVYQLGRHRLYCADSFTVDLGDTSAHSIVTDPPYGLSFMGKKWDRDVPSKELWENWSRFLRPGGHLLSFSGTRTYHRMTVAIEDAGFEVRDMMQWLYGSGFPKSLNVVKQAIKEGIACDCETQSEYDMRSVSEGNISSPINDEDESREILQPGMQEQSTSEQELTGTSTLAEGGQKSRMEGRNLRGAGEGISADSQSDSSEGEAEWLRPGTHSSSRKNSRKGSGTGRGSPSHKSRQAGQQTGEFKNLQQSLRTLDGASFPRCKKCSKAILQEGLGSALKPANEPICLARKPISEDTLAKNVLKHGTGGLNIDGGRIVTDEVLGRLNNTPSTFNHKNTTPYVDNSGGLGRFPSNVLLDEDAAAVLDEQSIAGGIHSAGKARKGSSNPRMSKHENPSSYSLPGNTGDMHRFDDGENIGASRFFYVAKPSKGEKGEENTHATVKPIRLMEYLLKLVTPEGGTVLEPFCGSGTTLLAAEKLGVTCIASELDPRHCDIILARWEQMTGDKAILIS